MQAASLRLLCLAAVLSMASGCLVRSVHPWFDVHPAVEEPALAVTWRDDKARTTAIFTAAGDGYAIEAIDGQHKTSHLQASLHRIGEMLLMQIAPSDPEGLNGFVLLPAHLLYKADLHEDSLTLRPIELDEFEARAAKARMPLLAEGSANDGFVLTASSADVEAFLLGQLADPAFFSDTPHYTFQKVSGAP